MTLGPGIARTPLPQKFLSSGVHCGVRRYRPDLGVLISEVDSLAVGVFTQSELQAAPVIYSRSLVPSRDIRAVITNSGQANAATGSQGTLRNLEMAEGLAKVLSCASRQILTASTGVIGVPLEIDKIVSSIPELVTRAVPATEPFSLAILTTDLVPKTVSTDVTLSQGVVRITGICKGSGMIHPNMGTMLGYLLTDAKLELSFAQSLLTDVSSLTFNMISVDGETSPNDSVFLLANGASQVELLSEQDEKQFSLALYHVSEILAQSIARDGEGSTKLIEVELHGAPDELLAQRAARSVVVSPLVKSAMHGEDPNWGRILARLGAERVSADCLNRLTLKIQGTTLFDCGAPIPFDKILVRSQLKTDTVHVDIDLHSGKASAKAWGCDLSRKYVEINAEYLT